MEYEHAHKYFIFQVKADFEPVGDGQIPTLYQRVEYATMGCNCGDAIRTRVRSQEHDGDKQA